MMSLLKKFRREETGAVTVDWVVLTAAVCGLAVAAIVSIEGASGSAGARVGTSLANAEPGNIGN